MSRKQNITKSYNISEKKTIVGPALQIEKTAFANRNAIPQDATQPKFQSIDIAHVF
jgi:hypothetical protein